MKQQNYTVWVILCALAVVYFILLILQERLY